MVDDKEARTRAPAATTLPVREPLTEAEDDEGPVPFDLPPAGYQLGALIGKGGMGEVIAAQDQRIGREVAFKRMRKADAGSDALGRFLREARIQARLDHPAIVPVYELGKDAEGRPFFTMKRVTGKTLTEHLGAPEASSARTTGDRARLLRAFADVCLAIELAHARGVVHRDLKPSNIMLGDYGEVYVLDWGVARVLASKHATSISAQVTADIDTVNPDETVDGDMLGTPGYMAPEQVRGELDLGPPADVYALGSILFEILAGEPLHPRGQAALASTLTMTGDAPATRRPDRAIAPELDSACAAALVAEPAARPTARALGDRVQRYLDGDRDLEKRRALAKEHLAAARAALASGDPNRRGEAMREAGRALALDPASTEAADLVSSLIIAPPTEMPAELVDTIHAGEIERAKVRARNAVIGYLSLLVLAVFLPWMNIESWPTLAAVIGGVFGFCALLWTTYKSGRIHVWPILIGGLVMAVLFSRLASPFVLVPVLMCGAILPMSNMPYINDRPWLLYAWTVVAGLLPLVLEWTGVIAATTIFADGRFILDSAIFGDTGVIDMIALVVANTVLLVVISRFSIAIARDRRSVQRQLTNQAWHLGKLLPTAPITPSVTTRT